MNKKILILGATGFIGRNIAEFFAEKEDYEVYGTYHSSGPFNNPGIKMIRSDLTNKSDVCKVIKGMDIVIQSAATTSGAKDIVNKPHYHVTDNALMNSLIFRAAHDYNVSHVIFFSCTTMYQSCDSPIKEADFDANKEINPVYYGGAWTKVYNEKMCEFYSRTSSAKYTVIRHSNIYGPYDKFDLEKSHVFGATITKVMTAEDGDKIVVWGTGEEERDLLYVSDLVDFVEIAIGKQESGYELLNAGYGSSVSVKELTEKIIAHSKKNIDINFDHTMPSIKTKLCLNCNKAKEVLGWAPKVSLDSGIKNTLKWYKDNIRF